MAAGVLLAAGLALELPGRATPTEALEQFFARPEGSISLGELRRRIEQVARCHAAAYEIILADAIAEADAAELHQAKRAQQERHSQARRVSAYVLNDHDLAKLLRYGSQLDREFDRTLKQFETAQSARNGVPSPRLEGGGRPR